MRQAILARQSALRDTLEARHYHVYAAMQHLLNAVFVTAQAGQIDELKSMPGVTGVVPVRRYKPLLNRALQMLNVWRAWALQDPSNSLGLGMKIAILDTGIDNTHQAFLGASLNVQANYPVCKPEDCQFTNNKIIVARSYTRLLVGSGAETRPDDYSARDLIGHGTAVASAAAGENSFGPLASINGVAPRAYLGNYKVFGSSEINGFASSDGIDQALEDAVTDGMHVAVLSLGGPAFTGPADAGASCGQPAGVPCDLESVTIKNAVAMGMVVVVAAGNAGGDSNTVLNSISSPGVAEDAITVAAITNSHSFAHRLQIYAPNLSSGEEMLVDNPGDSVRPAGTLEAQLWDVSRVGDALGCAPFPAGSLIGFIALIQRGTCSFEIKVGHASDAGALGVVFSNYADDDSTPPMSGLATAAIPSVIIGGSDGDRLRNLLTDPRIIQAYMAPNFVEDSATGNLVASFSSRGPAAGQGSLKPDIAAVGTNVYMATQRFDPYGALYNAHGYTFADGTSFSAPMVAGAAAMVRQGHPTFTPLQIKSALVNSAARDSQGLGTGNVLEVGGGRLDAAAAVSSNVTIEPPTVSFGVLTGGNLPKSQQFVITNFSGATVTLALSVNRVTTDSATQLTLDRGSLTLAPGSAGPITLTLSGSRPTPGDYQGAIEIAGSAVPLHIPYLYVVGDGVPNQIVTLVGDGGTGTLGRSVPDGFIAFKVIDRFGVPVKALPVTFSVANPGQGSISKPDSRTDAFGIAGASITLPAAPCTAPCLMVVNATAGALKTTFTNAARAAPSIAANGIVDAASFLNGSGIVPGSYISLFGTGLAESTKANNLPFLPLAIDSTFVSFDSGTLSYPGRMYYVSPTQVNVQVPWELAGQTSTQIKVNIDFSPGNLITVPVVTVAPAIFAYTDASLHLSVAAALDESNAVVNGANRVARGHMVQLFVNALGAVDNTPASGAAAPALPLSSTVTTPSVSIGGQPAVVQFSGLAPGFSGLYQVNAVVPTNIGAGVQPVVISSDGIVSPPTNLPVQ